MSRERVKHWKNKMEKQNEKITTKQNTNNPYAKKPEEPFKKHFDKKTMLKEALSGMFVLVFALIFAYVIGCPFRRLIGIPCPGCGMSRALIHFAMGEFETSFYFHPLLFTLPVFFAIFIFWKYIPKKIETGLLIALAVLFLAVYFYRVFVLKSEVTSICFEESLLYYLLRILGILH